MLSYLYTANSIWQSLTISFVCLFFSLLSMLILRRFWPTSDRPRFKDIHGHIFGVIGIIYAVLIGAIAVGCWEKYKHADELVYKEVMSSLNIYRSASGLEPSKGNEVKQLIKNYVINVKDNEWDAMRSGKSLDLIEPNILTLNNLLTKIHPENKTQEIFLTFLVEETNKLREIRGMRLFLATSSLNRIILQFIFFGSFLLILAGIFFGIENSLLSNIIIVSTLSVVTGLVLSIIMGLDHPYQGNIMTSQDPFVSVLQLMNSPAN